MVTRRVSIPGKLVSYVVFESCSGVCGNLYRQLSTGGSVDEAVSVGSLCGDSLTSSSALLVEASWDLGASSEVDGTAAVLMAECCERI